MTTTRTKIVAKCESLRLKTNGDKWEMTGGKFGSHVIYEPCYNNRVHAHWFGYCQNNGAKPNAADNCPCNN